MILFDRVAPRRRMVLDVAPQGWFATNPSLIRVENGYVGIIKCINFDIDEVMRRGKWQAVNGERIANLNMLLYLDDQLNVLESTPLDTSAVTRQAVGHGMVEDIRLFHHAGTIRACGTLYDRDFAGAAITRSNSRVFVAELALDALDNASLLPSPTDSVDEKNWLPWPQADGPLRAVVNANTGATLAEENGWAPHSDPAPFNWRGGWSGSSPIVRYRNNHYAILHRKAGRHLPLYEHAFALFGASGPTFSAPFRFEGHASEFCCGLDLCEETGLAVIGYGIGDKTAIAALVDAEALIATVFGPKPVSI